MTLSISTYSDHSRPSANKDNYNLRLPKTVRKDAKLLKFSKRLKHNYITCIS